MIENSNNFQLINDAFPHIGNRLKSLWGMAEFKEVIEELEQDKRGGLRKGFSEGVLFALHHLDTEHDQAFPGLARQSGIWGFVN